MKWARQSGVTEAQVESLHNYQRLLERHLGASDTQINLPAGADSRPLGSSPPAMDLSGNGNPSGN